MSEDEYAREKTKNCTNALCMKTLDVDSSKHMQMFKNMFNLSSRLIGSSVSCKYLETRALTTRLKL